MNEQAAQGFQTENFSWHEKIIDHKEGYLNTKVAVKKIDILC